MILKPRIYQVHKYRDCSHVAINLDIYISKDDYFKQKTLNSYGGLFYSPTVINMSNGVCPGDKLGVLIP